MANAYTANIRRILTVGGVTVASNENIGYDTLTTFKQVMPASQSGVTYVLGFKYTSKLKFMYILASVDMSVAFGSAGASGDITLKAGVPKIITYSGTGGTSGTALEYRGGTSGQGSTAAEVVTADVAIANGIQVTNTLSGTLEIYVGYNN